MRRQTRTSLRSERSAIARATRQMKVTNEEILSDLLYPAPASKLVAPPRKHGR